jgi:PKD repeat protein
MTVIAGADQRVFTGFPLSFSGHALGLYDESLPYATHRWNFGDGTTAEGSGVSHVYRFSGEYTVTLEAFYGSLKNSDRITVAVSDPDAVITRVATGTAGFIEISNPSGREIDLAGWSLVMPMSAATSGKKFFFAQNTILLSGKSVRFPNMVTQLGSTAGVIQLRTPTGTLVHTYGDARPTLPAVGAVAGAMTIKQPEEIFTSPKISQGVSMSPSPKSLAFADTQRIVSGEAMPSASGAAATVLWERGAVPAPGQFSSEMRWFFVFMGFLLVALAGFIIVRSRVDQATIADEYAIIEDIIESEADLVRKSQKILVE